MPPKQRWALVPGSVPASTMEAAKEQLRTFNDLGKNPKYEWIRTVGGSADRCQYFSIQPRDDTVEEEGDGEESDEDLDGM